MFNRLRFIMKTRQLIKSLGGNPKNPTINEMIAITPIMLLLERQKNSTLFSNRYVCADAAIISCAYAIKALNNAGASDHLIIDLKSKTLAAISSQFRIVGDELSNLQRNRFEFFGSILDKEDDGVSQMLSEAALVFTYDLSYNKYVEYTEDSPLIIIGFDEQMLIEGESYSYFKSALKLVNKCIQQYFI